MLRDRSPRRPPALVRRLAAAVAAAALSSGCSWGTKARPARSGERLELESLTVTVPEGQGWAVSRERDAGWRELRLLHSIDGTGWDRRVVIRERTDAGAPGSREAWAAALRADVPVLVGDRAATVTELPASPQPRFGPSAVEIRFGGVESDARAGLLVKRLGETSVLEFVPPQAPDRLCTILYEEALGRRASLEKEGDAWQPLVDGVALRPVDATAIRAAARPDFPKEFEPGLARRSLTLPRHGFQWFLQRERWIEPGGLDGGWGLAYGITDRLQAFAPASLRYAFGDPAALAGPEVAIGGGLRSWDHDAERGSVWGVGVEAAARRRLSADVAARAAAVLEDRHESRTGRDRLHAAGAGGVVWDVAGQLVSLGLEAGYSWSDEPDAADRVAWVGGQVTPLVSLHAPLLDVGLLGGVGWRDGEIGALAGFALTVTF